MLRMTILANQYSSKLFPLLARFQWHFISPTRTKAVRMKTSATWGLSSRNMEVFWLNSMNVSLTNWNQSTILCRLLTFSTEKSIKPVGSLILWKLESFWTHQNTSLSIILMKSQRKLPLELNRTSNTLLEKPSKYLKLRFKTSPSLRARPSGWRLSELKNCHKDRPIPWGTSGKLWSEEVLRTTWKKLWRVTLGTAMRSARSQRCSWFKQWQMTETVSLNLASLTKLRALALLKELLTARWSLTVNSKTIRVQRNKRATMTKLSLISQLQSIKQSAAGN